jgi:hypothetical protein
MRIKFVKQKSHGMLLMVMYLQERVELKDNVRVLKLN